MTSGGLYSAWSRARDEQAPYVVVIDEQLIVVNVDVDVIGSIVLSQCSNSLAWWRRSTFSLQRSQQRIGRLAAMFGTV